MSPEDYGNLMNLLRLVGGKFILIEDGRPQAVLMSYREFQDLASAHAENRLVEAARRIDEVNQEITRAQLVDLRQEVIADVPDEIRIVPLD